MKISRKRNYEYYWSFLSLFCSKAEKYDKMMIEKKKIRQKILIREKEYGLKKG